MRTFEKYRKFNTYRNTINKLEPIFLELRAAIPMSEAQFHNIYICALEAFNNAIIHGNKLNNSKIIEIYVYVENNIVHIEIIDEGNGFNEASIPNPLDPENIVKDHGRGIFIIDRLCTKRTYTMTQRGFCISMLFDLNNKKQIITS